MLGICLTLSFCLFAVDGIVIKSKSGKTSFSTMKKNLTLSIKDGFSYKDNKTFGFKRVGHSLMFNNIISYQKGNITYILPYRSKIILNKFKTPQKPQ